MAYETPRGLGLTPKRGETQHWPTRSHAVRLTDIAHELHNSVEEQCGDRVESRRRLALAAGDELRSLDPAIAPARR